MKREGPAIETLLRRLEDTPPDFLERPATAREDGISVGALVSDLFRLAGITLAAEKIREYGMADDDARRNEASLRALASWFLGDEALSAYLSAKALERIFGVTISALSAEHPAAKYAADPDRREEFARLLLSDCGLRPAGETAAQAEDRLQSLSSAQRRKMIAATREAEKRAREIRAALAKKAAEDAADKYTRE